VDVRGCLFFDIFYVGATFNVSAILNLAPSGRGVLLAFSTFVGVMAIWNEKAGFYSKFMYEKTIYSCCRLCFSSTHPSKAGIKIIVVVYLTQMQVQSGRTSQALNQNTIIIRAQISIPGPIPR
jgi:hypothetical protein